MEEEYDYGFTLFLMGNNCVGKTSLLCRLHDNSFDHSQRPTYGLRNQRKMIDLNGQKIKLEIWEITNAVKSWWNTVWRNTEGFIIVFDISHAGSFHSLSNWIDSLKNASKRKSILIVGNKSDLGALREVSYDKAKAFAERNGIKYIEVSALTGYNVEALFRLMAMEIISKFTLLY